MRLILGSSSKWRRQLWQQHFPDECNAFMSPDIDEKAIRHEDAETLTMLIANAKADALVAQLRRESSDGCALLVCMDQVVVCEGRIREKPVDAEQVRAYWASYSAGAPATCVNGVVVHNLETGVRCGANEVASVSFEPVHETIVTEAIARGSIFDSAGAFAIEDPLFKPFVKKVDGSAEAIIGLPLDTLRALLARAGGVPGDLSGRASLPRARGLPGDVAPDFVVRPVRPSDEAASRACFEAGMHETVSSGVRRELLRADLFRSALMLAAATVAKLVLPPRALGVAAALVTCGLAGAIAWFPRYVADEYIARSLATDMHSPCAHYLSTRGRCFWVAIEASSGALAGTIAIEPPSGADGLKWRSSDAELRRMSVMPWARRRGVARALFAEVLRFAEQSPQYERLVLSTSTLQRVAHDWYPTLGFVAETFWPVFGRIGVTQYTLLLTEPNGNNVGSRELERA